MHAASPIKTCHPHLTHLKLDWPLTALTNIDWQGNTVPVWGPSIMRLAPSNLFFWSKPPCKKVSHLKPLCCEEVLLSHREKPCGAAPRHHCSLPDLSSLAQQPAKHSQASDLNQCHEEQKNCSAKPSQPAAPWKVTNHYYFESYDFDMVY